MPIFAFPRAHKGLAAQLRGRGFAAIDTIMKVDGEEREVVLAGGIERNWAGQLVNQLLRHYGLPEASVKRRGKWYRVRPDGRARLVLKEMVEEPWVIGLLEGK